MARAKSELRPCGIVSGPAAARDIPTLGNFAPDLPRVRNHSSWVREADEIRSVVRVCAGRIPAELIRCRPCGHANQHPPRFPVFRRLRFARIFAECLCCHGAEPRLNSAANSRAETIRVALCRSSARSPLLSPVTR